MSFKNGKLNGLKKGYYEDGQLKLKLFYKNDKIEGLVQTYYKNNQLESAFNYEAGKRKGLFKKYSQSNELLFIQYWQGRSVIIVYDKNEGIDNRKDYADLL